MEMNAKVRFGRAVGVCAAVAALTCASTARAERLFEGYMDHAALLKAAQELAAANANCRVDVIGESRQGRTLIVLTLADDFSKSSKRPALLMTSGLDARHRVGPETAIRVTRKLLADHADLLGDMTVYIIPCVNPDGMERNGGSVNYGHIGTLRMVDEDRDGRADEDGPQDLNGDGAITMIRRPDPPLDDAATMMADPAEPRLLKRPVAEKGERATYSVYPEGLDSDGDGNVAEDGPGQIDLDRNFMHRWPEHEMNAGPHQLSEPEAAALATFVLQHRNIVEAITYGRHDNLINTPDPKPRDPAGAPLNIDGDDLEWYKEIGKSYKKITGQERAPSDDAAGSFHAWLYAQRGIPSFATVVWGRPEPSKTEDEHKDDKTADAKSDDDDQKKDDRKAKKEGKDDKPKPADEEAAAWLQYSDRDRNHEGFIAWTPFDHPTLGRVEIGGFVPGFQMNPPSGQLDALADKQTAFVVEMMKKRPRLTIQGPSIKRLAAGLYEIRFGVVNEGYLPTTTAMARKARSILPTVIRLSVPSEQIVAGERVTRAWGINGSGDRFTQRWIVRVADGEDIQVDIHNPQLGDQSMTFKAEERP
jgi:hypothetical protein